VPSTASILLEPPSDFAVADDFCKIEIIGNAKTGTTGLFNSVRAPLRAKYPDALLLFEPRTSSLGRLSRHNVPFSLLAKAMVNKNGIAIGYKAFTHHVLISRDPRDTLVSQLLYLPLQPYGVRSAGQKRLDEMLSLLHDKERDPASHSFREVFERSIALMDRDKEWTWEKYLERFDVAERISDRYECFLFKYEDFTDNRLDALSSYLGLHVEPIVPDSVEVQNGHVVRSATHGEWRNWFVADDVEFFRPLFKRYMDTFGYDDDWAPAAAPHIAAETASGYILARRPVVEAKMARRFGTAPEWVPESVTTPEEAEAIRLAAEDSEAARAGYRYATLLLEGRVVPRDPARAFDYAYRAALIGTLGAIDMVARMYREGLGVEQDLDLAAKWDDEAATLRAEPKPKPVPKPAPQPAAAAPPPRPRPEPTSMARWKRRVKRVVARGTRTVRRTGASGD
jgi:Sel1 repeat